MRHIGKLAGVVLASALALSACGTTADTTTPNQPSGTNTTADAGNNPAPEATGQFDPSDVAKPKDGKKLKIGAAFPILDQFLQNVADGMQKRADEAGVELVIVSAQERADLQLSQVENFVAQGMDGVIILPQDTEATQPMTDALVAAKIPLVYVNRRPANLDPSIPYAGSDSLVSGVLQMEELVKLSGGKGNVAILQGDPSQEAAQLRTQGCKDVIAKNPDMKLIREQAGNWYREKGLQITENWIQSGDQIDIICSNNDEMALGAIQALKQAGMLDDVLVGGVDATADALIAMEAGELEVTVFQDAQGQGAAGVDSIIRLYNGEAVPSYIDIPYQLVTPENMADFK